ncbi:MAG TPA: LptA/OstA family protein [Candidatus Aminicenantes bacterium]|nr:LptA/OstA family protein [Candidatus Aminicenantes bacterium]HRY64339.1 LptA/OstA family protein [Candidatus Aminicenantes bacterium]HRZ71252.1 LptA/OstA family protein [Candidatus Aminicenantes bacterium]
MSAQKASAPVRFARIAAAAALVVVAAAIAARLAGRREPPSPAVPAAPPDRVVDLQERVRQREFKDGRPVADIRGDRFFRGPDGRSHLAGSVEVVSFGPAGQTASRLTAGEVSYAPGSLRFAFSGDVRAEAGGFLLQGDAFEYDKAKGLFETKTGGRFSSASMAGRAATILCAESAGEIRLGGGFQAGLGPPGRPGEALNVAGDSFEYVRLGRRGRIDGRAVIDGGGFRGSAGSVSFVALPDESGFASAAFENAAAVDLEGDRPEGGGGKIRADRISVTFGPGPAELSLQARGGAELFLRSPDGGAATVSAETIVLSRSRADGPPAWSASGGVRVEMTGAGPAGRTLAGDEAACGPDGALRLSGRPGRPAVADSAETRVEAPLLDLVFGAGNLTASGGTACVLKRGEGPRPMGFFSPAGDVAVACERLDLEPGASRSSFAGHVVVSQGRTTLRAAKLDSTGDRLSGAGGIALTLVDDAAAGRPGRTVELGGEEMSYEPGRRILTLTARAFAGLPEARLEASTVTAVIGEDGRSVERLEAAGGVVVSKGRYTGRSEAASYDAAAGRLTLTGRPVLNDGQGGSARGAKLTFDLADDKILIENEGAGRATTVVRS